MRAVLQCQLDPIAIASYVRLSNDESDQIVDGVRLIVVCAFQWFSFPFDIRSSFKCTMIDEQNIENRKITHE